MITRIAAKKLIDLAEKFKAVAVTGARQAEKTTLVKEVFRTKHTCGIDAPGPSAPLRDR